MRNTILQPWSVAVSSVKMCKEPPDFHGGQRTFPLGCLFSISKPLSSLPWSTLPNVNLLGTKRKQGAPCQGIKLCQCTSTARTTEPQLPCPYLGTTAGLGTLPSSPDPSKPPWGHPALVWVDEGQCCILVEVNSLEKVQI